VYLLTIDRAQGVDHCDVALVARIITGLFDEATGRALFGETALTFGCGPILLAQAAVEPLTWARKIVVVDSVFLHVPIHRNSLRKLIGAPPVLACLHQ
jgi:hypothetical protein